MPCTTTWVGTAIALCYMLCTMDTATKLHAWVPPSLYTIYAMHCGYHHMLRYCHCFILYMLCTTDTTTCLDIPITLYYILCTTDTATCMGTAIALYYMLCTEHLQALPLVHIIIVCLYCYFIPADRATTCMVLPSLYYIICPRYCPIKVWHFIMMNIATHMVLYAIIAGLAYHLFIQNACGTCVPVLVTVYIICTYVCCWHPTVF